MFRSAARQIVAIGTTAFALAGCGQHATGGSQVAVKVNKDEITVLQVNQQIARLAANVPENKRDEETRRIIGALIDQKLLVQQAMERKLDRDPEVLGALEAARQQILAQAYVQRVLGPQAKPSEQDIKQYYADNPALFGERKLYRLQELTIRGTPEQINSIDEHAKNAKSLQELAVWLKDNKLEFNVDSAVRSAEQIPLGRLSQLSKTKDGQVTVFRADATHASAVQVLGTQAQPVDDKQAGPAIEVFLTNRKRDQLAQEDVKRLREAAKIEYVGDFSRYSASAAVQGAPATETAASAVAVPAAASAAETPKTSSTDKGLVGLH